MAEINEFDDQLKDALSNLGNDISPGDWNSFAEKLDAANDLSPLEQPSDFDDLIRNRMESLEVGAEGNYWEMMESKIDQELNIPEISDEALDNLATESLSNLYIPYNPTHWTLLSHRLEEEFNVRRKIVNYKVAEFSLMVLLLLTIVQFMPSYPATISDKNDMVAETQIDLWKEIDAPTEIATSTSIADANVKSIIKTNEISTTNIASSIKENIVSSIVLSAPSESIIALSSDKNKKEVLSKTTNVDLVIALPLEETLRNDIDDQTLSTSVDELPSATISTLDHTTDWSAIGAIKKFSKKVTVRLGAMTSADINQINTPSTSTQKDNSYQQYQLGYGGGITLDFNYEKLTLSTGLIYHRINYYPQQEINIGGSFANGYQSRVFDAVNLNLLTIPMNLQFQINNPDKKWKLHAITGASLNVLALNHYNVTVNNLGNNNSNLNFPIPSSPDAEETPQIELEREADIAGEGFFEGGSFQRNHYFTANIGIGVERFISPRWSLFLQPIYQHEVFGKNLGLNRDRIHTFSIQIGAKSTFK